MNEHVKDEITKPEKIRKLSTSFLFIQGEEVKRLETINIEIPDFSEAMQKLFETEITPAEVVIENAYEFLNVLKLVNTMIDEISMVIYPFEDRVIIRELDLAEVSMIDVKIIPVSYTLQSNSYPLQFRFRISDFITMMPKLSKKDYETLRVVVERESLTAVVANTRFKIPVYDVKLLTGESREYSLLPLPKVYFKTSVFVDLKDFYDAVYRFRTLFDRVRLSINDRSFIISSKSEVSENSVTLGINDYEYLSDETAWYDLNRLLKVLGALKKLSGRTDTVKVEFSTDIPLKITYKPNGSSILDFITYYLAPRMEKE